MSTKVINFLKKSLPYFVFIFVCLSFFWPFFKSGKVPIALDIPTGMYYPWLNHSYGFAVKVPVKNPILTDTVSQFWIWRNWAMEGVLNNQIRIWNPHSFSGYEVSPWFHSTIFSPLNIFYFFTDKLNAMSLVVIFQVVLSLFATYFLAIKLTGHRISAVFFSLSWTLSSFFIGWLTWGTVSLTLASMPLVLLYLTNLNKTKHEISPKILLFFATITLFLSGHPQTIAYMLFIIFCYLTLTFYKTKDWSYLFSAVTIFLVSLIFLSPVILPSLTIIKNSIRSLDGHLHSVNYGLIKWYDLAGLILTPNFFGNPATGNYFGNGYNFQEKLVYFGVVPLFFSIAGLFSFLPKKKSLTTIQYLGVILVFTGLLFSIDGPIGRLIYYLHIPVLSASPAGRGLVVFIFGALLISLHSFTDLLKKKAPFRFYLYSFVVLTFAYLFSLTITQLVLRFISDAPQSLHEVYLPLKNNYTVMTRNLIPMFIILVATFFLTIFSYFSKKLSEASLFLICLLIIADSFLFFKKYTPFVPKNLYYPETETINFLKKEQSSHGYFRVERQSAEILPPNMWEAFGLFSASGYDPMASRTYQDFLINQNIISSYTRYVELGDKLAKVENLGIKYFLVLRRDQFGILSDKGDIPHFVDKKVWKEVFTEGPVSVLENTRFKTPYQLASTASADLIFFSDNRLSFQLNSITQNTLTFYQNYSKNWKIEGGQAGAYLTKSKDGYLDINFPPGDHNVTLVYKNQDFSLGLIFTFLSLILLYFVIKKPNG